MKIYLIITGYKGCNDYLNEWVVDALISREDADKECKELEDDIRYYRIEEWVAH